MDRNRSGTVSTTGVSPADEAALNELFDAHDAEYTGPGEPETVADSPAPVDEETPEEETESAYEDDDDDLFGDNLQPGHPQPPARSAQPLDDGQGDEPEISGDEVDFETLIQTPQGKAAWDAIQARQAEMDRIAEQHRQEQERQFEEQKQRRLQEMLQQLKEMDPEDRANYIAQQSMAYAARLEADKNEQAESARLQQEVATQRAATINWIAQGGRNVNGQFIANARKQLSADDRSLLESLDIANPLDLEKVADRMLAKAVQTKAAVRQATAARRRSNGEGLDPAPGRGAPGGTPREKEPETLDELFDMHDSTYRPLPLQSSKRRTA
jgi:hypothetical protein